jgi:uncharacterized protein (DUF983 family)
MSDPYGALDPRRGPGEPAPREAGILLALGRGLRRRCPRCGDRRIFDDRTTLRATCPRCSLRFEQEEGGFLGAMTINYTFAFLVWMLILGIVLAFTVPDVPQAPLIAMSVVVLVGVPLWFYPRSKAMWAAVEWLANRTAPDYRGAIDRDERSRRLD